MMGFPDFGLIANAYGIPYEKVTELEHVDGAIHNAIKHDGAYVLEFICDPTEVILPMIPSKNWEWSWDSSNRLKPVLSVSV